MEFYFTGQQKMSAFFLLAELAYLFMLWAELRDYLLIFGALYKLLSQESPKKKSSEWTDEKHSLYLKSMEASFVDQLYNSLDMRSWQIQNECSSDTMSSRRHHASTPCPSGQVRYLVHHFICHKFSLFIIGFLIIYIYISV